MFTNPCARANSCGYVARMKTILFACSLVLICVQADAAAKRHLVALGRWSVVTRLSDEDGSKLEDIKVRPLFVDGQIKEYTVGPAHDVTERVFVVRRIFRLNDALPQESGPIRWRWEPGGWVVVNRLSGKVQTITLPGFDPDSSTVSWYRDYAAYCGVAGEAKKSLAMIVQLGRRRPLLSKAIENVANGCNAPQWQRNPPRATFETGGGQKFTFAVGSQSADLVNETAENASEE